MRQVSKELARLRNIRYQTKILPHTPERVAQLRKWANKLGENLNDTKRRAL